MAKEEHHRHQHTEDSHAVDAATNTVTASSQGAMFVAGFAYYEVGRFRSGNMDRAYLVLLTGALVFAIMTAAVGAGFSRYCIAQDATATWRGGLFAREGVWVVRATYRYYLVAITLYMASLARVGFQYYNPNTTGHCRIVPAVFAIAALCAFVRAYRHVVSRFLVVAEQREDRDRRAGRADSGLAAHVQHQGSVISAVSIFVMSFAQAGVTRFSPENVNMDSGNIFGGISVLAGFYLLSSACAFSCAAYAVFTTCTILVFIHDLEGAERKEYFAQNVQDVFWSVQLASLVALLSFNTSFSTLGWGCGYATYRDTPAYLGYFSLMVFTAISLALLHAALRGAQPRKHDPSLLDPSAAALTVVEQLESRLRTICLRSSITAGYVFYHVASFASDIRADAPLGFAYLAIHCVAFALGLTCCTVAHVACMCLSNAHADCRVRMVHTVAWVEHLIGIFFWLSLVAFVIGFGLISSVKHGTSGLSSITAWLAAVTLAALMVATLALRHHKQKHTPCATASPPAEYGLYTKSDAAKQQHGALADQAFQFGSLGYFCTLFLSRGHVLAPLYCWIMGSSFTMALFLVAFVTMVSLAGVEAAWVDTTVAVLHVLSVSTFQIGFVLLGVVKPWQQLTTQGLFVRETGRYYALVCICGTVLFFSTAAARMILPTISVRPQGQSVWSALSAKCRLKHQQLVSNSAADQPVDSGAATATTLWRRLRFSFVDRVAAGCAPSAARQCQFAASVKQLQGIQAQTCFVSGNVFFEVLFSHTVANQGVATVVYIGGAVLTFCTCALCHTLSSAMIALSHSSSALDFGAESLVMASARVSQVTTGLMLGAMTLWMASICASGSVKYPPHAFVSVAWGATGLVLLVLHFVDLRGLCRVAGTRHQSRPKQARSVDEMSIAERIAFNLLRVWVDSLATYRLWWRLAALYLVVVFALDILPLNVVSLIGDQFGKDL